MKFIKIFFLFSLCIFNGSRISSQSTLKNEVYSTYDAIVSSNNSTLYNGTEFTDLFLNTDGTYRYYNSYDYVKGSVTYNGQYYVNVLLKYDLLDDNLLTRSDDNLSIFNVKLIPDFVESFSIFNSNFVRLATTNLNLPGNSFFEEAYVGDQLSIYIKHTKKIKDRALKTGIQYRFLNNNSYVLKKNENYYLITSAKDFRELLPEREEEIQNFYRSNKSLNKSNPDIFMLKLVQYIDGLTKTSSQ